MEAMRRSRLRSGASRRALHRVGEHPELFTEQVQVPTWREHQLQHDGRLTAEDRAIEDAAFAHIIGTARTRHLTPTTARDTSPQRPDHHT
jgi:Transmembrane secretion effector